MSLQAAFPNYLQMRRVVPVWVWRVGSAFSVAAAVATIVLLFVDPRTGLIAWWLVVVPALPIVWLLAPGLWRNVCPMAALNQVPRWLGFTRGRTVPPWLRRNALLVQIVLYVSLITTRAPLLDHNGPAVGVLMIVALAAAFAGGVVYKGKSGWCGTFCPLMPIQRLYGQTPAVVVANQHCTTCVGCMKNCYDFNPRVAAAADLYDDDAHWASQRKLFAGAFPGFVLAFFLVPHSVVGASSDMRVSLLTFYALVVVYMLASLGLYFVVDALTPIPPVVLTAVAAAVALNVHNAFGFRSAWHLDKPAALRVAEGIAVALVTAWFVVRTWRRERELLAAVAAPDELRVRPGAGLAEARMRGGVTHEVTFAPKGPTAVSREGATLLEVAERAELPIEPGCRMGVCGADPVTVLAGAEHLSEAGADERATLARLGLGSSCRLACVARVNGNVEVSLDVSANGSTAPAAPGRVDESVRRVVVIGNGIAGVTAADHVRRRHPDCTIDLVGDEVHQLYNRMAISRLVYGRTAMSGLLLLSDDWHDKQRVTPWLNTQVRAIDRSGRAIVLGTGERLAYDRLILATGSAAALPPIPGVEREGVFAVRTADDASAVRAYAQRNDARRAFVVGGGPLGIEVAYALHRLGLRVRIVQRSDRLMPRELDARASSLLERYLEGLGIGVELGVAPAAVSGNGSASALELADGRALELDLLVVCAGISPHVALAAEAGLEIRRGVVVDDRMQTSDPAIFAAGDVAEPPGGANGLWPTAVAQAEVAAANAVGDDLRYEPAPPVAVLKGVGLDVTSAGVVELAPGDEEIVAPADDGAIRYARLVVRDGRVAGATFVGPHPALAGALQAAAAGEDVSDRLDVLRSGDWRSLEA